MAGTPSAAGGVFLYIHKFAKPQKEGGTSGTQNVRFCDLQTCGLLAPKKKMENLQMRNSQITIAEIWDTLLDTMKTLASHGLGEPFFQLCCCVVSVFGSGGK
jgi:hypothetical protein